MPTEIKNTCGDLLLTVEADNLTDADLGGAYLRGANLGGADLGGAYLTGAHLGGADLRGAYLRGAYLTDADLTGADLIGAHLRGADLRDAYLGGAYLTGAYLTGAKMAWDSHELVAELLRRAAGADVEKRKAAGLVLVSQGWCWDKLLGIDDPLRDWALDVLAGYVADGDNAPAVLRDRRAALYSARETK